MSTLDFLRKEFDPFDILFTNQFNVKKGSFAPLLEAKIGYPVDIYETQDTLVYEVACTGIDKSKVNVSLSDNLLKISYDKSSEEDKYEGKKYHVEGIARRSFDFSFKINTSKYNLQKADAEFKNGLLRVQIPLLEERLEKVLKIK